MLSLVDTVKFSDDADNIRYDEAIVDSKSKKRIGDIPLSGHPESFQLEESGARVFVNVPPANHVAVVDRSKRAVIAAWPLAGAKQISLWHSMNVRGVCSWVAAIPPKCSCMTRRQERP